MRAYFVHVLLIFFFVVACSETNDPKIAFETGQYEKAYQLWQPLAFKGDFNAQNYLGIHNYLGLGIKRNYKQAKEWFEKSAMQGHADAQYNLAVMYENGQHVKQDYEMAAMWYSVAIELGNENAKRRRQALLDEHKLFLNQYNRAKELGKQYR